ncbi:Clp1/GlmU family protein [Thiohalorhabdus methylotrophus]|uniref:Clp1/GlmU family protein n=1 Tax=Thiohalorhabdus methylotrophus TaxID=3242694 RepID=A0ABV4TXZ5_9GAMM
MPLQKPISEAQDLDIPDSWVRTASALLAEGRTRVMVAGGADRGKSSFCRYLAARALEMGKRVAFLDTDVGQKDIGPPAALTLKLLHPTHPAAEAPDGFYFVGSVSPRGHFLPIATGSEALLRGNGQDIAIVNTDGLVRGPGRVLRHYQTEALAPDTLVAIEREGEQGTIPVHTGIRIRRLSPAPAARERTSDQRRAARLGAFRQYFSEARRSALDLDLEHLRMERCLLFTGVPVEPHGFLYAEDTVEGRVVVGNRALPDPGTKRIPAGFERGLLCGMLDTEGTCVGLGVLEHLDFRARKLLLRSRWRERSYGACSSGTSISIPRGES